MNDGPRMLRYDVSSRAMETVYDEGSLARYMREKGVWDKKWDSRIAKR